MSALKVVIITLQDYPERMPHVRKCVEELSRVGLQCEIFYGVNGNSISITDTFAPHIKILEFERDIKLYDRRVRLNGKEMRRGEIGCAWSHYRVYEKLIADDTSNSYLVLEDDAELTVTCDRLLEYINKIPSDFDICRTTVSHWYPYKKLYAVNPYYFVYERRFSNSATSYIISKSGAQKLLTFMNNYLNIPSDDVLSTLYMGSPTFTSYASEEGLFVDKRTMRSLIETIS